MQSEHLSHPIATKDRAGKLTETVGLSQRTLLILVFGFSAGLLGKALIGSLSGGPDATPAVAQGESASPQADRNAIAPPAPADERAANRGAPASASTDPDVGRSNAAQPGAAPLVGDAAVEGRADRFNGRNAPPGRHSARKLAIDPELLRELSEDTGSDAAAPAESSEEDAGPPQFFEEGSEAATPLKASPNPAPSAPEAQTPRAPTAKLTLGHWNRLNEIIDQEAAMRGAPSGGVTASNAGDFLHRRIEAGRFAAGALRELPQAGVDTQLLAFSERLAAWYEKGAAICDKGKWLLEKASDAARKGPEGKAWQKNDKEHQVSVNALNTDGETLRRRLVSKYGVAFPKLK